MHRLVVFLCALAFACSSGASDSRPRSGGHCELEGSFEARGDFPSFSTWSFRVEGGALVDSHTDDLGPEEWATTLVRDQFGDLHSLVQVTDGSDAVIETTLHLRPSCDGDQLSLEAAGAYTVFHDQEGTFIEAHAVTISPAD